MTNSGDFSPTLILGAPPPQTPPRAFDRQPERPIQPERLSFTGKGSEYFSIWIVNLLLMILTLGIYSAWAKVRKLRYFYDSTHLAGSSFEYHGNPIAILKGRVIAVILIGAYNLSPKISMVAWGVMVLLLMAVMPWLVWKSLQFKLYNSSYRGIRFGFRGSLSQAYKVYLLLPILSGITLNLLAPFVHQRIKKFQHDESRFGTSHFSFHATVGGFYKAYLIALVIFIGGLLAIGAVFGGAIGLAASAGGITKGGAGVFIAAMLVMFGIYVWAFLLFSVFMTMIQNLIWNNTRLGEHQFKSDMKWGRVAFISITNIIGIALTLGLYTPFAKIRMMKYRVESVTLMPAGDLDNFVADVDVSVSAAGEGMTDLLDFDFAL